MPWCLLPLSFLKKYFYLCVWMFWLHVCTVKHTCVYRCPRRLGEVTGVLSCESLWGSWDSNLDPLEEQPGRLATEPSLQSPLLHATANTLLGCWWNLKHPDGILTLPKMFMFVFTVSPLLKYWNTAKIVIYRLFSPLFA